MFHVGDMVKALDDGSHYTITTRGWIGYVTRVINDDIICVSNSMSGILKEWRVSARYFELVKSTCIEEKEENKMDVKEIITEDERKSLLKDMEHLLDEYDYDYTDEALNKIINTWAENKADLITAFKKHPNYLKGKFMIVFSHNFARETSINALRDFAKWLLDLDNALAVREFMPDDMKDYCTSYGKKLPGAIFNFVINLYQFSDQYIDEATAGKFNEMLPDIHAHNGQKMSRVMNKLLTYIGYNKLPDYNREFAKYADAINPLQIVRHTVLSVNPLDYLTMSFGNSWASCHTIDKTNKRNMPNSYEGMYSSGTVSYMLDKPPWYSILWTQLTEGKISGMSLRLTVRCSIGQKTSSYRADCIRKTMTETVVHILLTEKLSKRLCPKSLNFRICGLSQRELMRQANMWYPEALTIETMRATVIAHFLVRREARMKNTSSSVMRRFASSAAMNMTNREIFLAALVK